jgi:hypothetical protein
VRTFTVLHVTDTHVRVGLHGGKHYVLERLASWTYRFASDNRVDVVLLTGDVADDGTPESIAELQSFLMPPPSGGPVPYLHPDARPTLASTKAPVFAMPGNHDRYQRGFRAPLYRSPGAGNVACDAPLRWTAGLGGIARFDVGAAGGPDSLAIIAADLSIHTPREAGDGSWAVAGRGKADHVTIHELAIATQRARQDGRAVLWALHFPPGFYSRYPGDAIERVFFSPYLELLYGRRVLQAAANNEITQIVAGHSHKRRHYVPVSGQRVFIHAGGTAAKVGAYSDVSVHVYHVDVDGGRIVDFRVQDYVLHPPYTSSFVATAPILNGSV